MCARLKWSEILKVNDDAFWLSVRAGTTLEECVDQLAVYLWQKNRVVLKEQHNQDVAPGDSFKVIEALIPRDFQRSEMRNFDTRILRALLDYILFLEKPDEGTCRRNNKEPYLRVDVIRCLRSIIPDHVFESFGYSKDKVALDDLGLVPNAARALLLELTEGKSGEGLTGNRVMPTLIADQPAEPAALKQEVSQPVGISTGSNLAGIVSGSSLTSNVFTRYRSRQSAAQHQPEVLGVAGYNLREMSDTKHRPSHVQGRRVSLPLLQSRAAQRNPSRKRSMSDIRRPGSKRTRPVDRLAVTDTEDEDIEHDAAELAGGPGKPVARKSMTAGILEQVQDLGLAFDCQEAEIERLKATVSTLQLENAELKAIVRRDGAASSIHAHGSSDLAYLKEARACLTEENGTLKDENAVLRTMVKTNGGSDEQIRAHMARMKEV